MGMFDHLFGKVFCVVCDDHTEHYGQTKAFLNQMNNYDIYDLPINDGVMDHRDFNAFGVIGKILIKCFLECTECNLCGTAYIWYNMTGGFDSINFRNYYPGNIQRMIERDNPAVYYYLGAMDDNS